MRRMTWRSTRATSAQHARHLGAVGRLAGTQDDGHRLAGDRLVDVDRQEAALAVVGVEARELLPPMHAVQGVVDVEHDPGLFTRRGDARRRAGSPAAIVTAVALRTMNPGE
jgi:hypothetical protein